MRLLVRLHRESKGQYLLDFALALPLVLLLCMTVLEVGNISYSYLIINQASREAAKMGMTGEPDPEIVNRIYQICSRLDVSRLTVEIRPVNVQDSDGGFHLYRGQGVPLSVKIGYQVYSLTPLRDVILPGPFPIQARSITRVDYGL